MGTIEGDGAKVEFWITEDDKKICEGLDYSHEMIYRVGLATLKNDPNYWRCMEKVKHDKTRLCERCTYNHCCRKKSWCHFEPAEKVSEFVEQHINDYCADAVET